MLSLASFDKPLPSEILLPLSEHTVVYNSVDKRGQGYFTLEGMAKFGLPGLELRDAPPGLMQMLTPILYGVGSLLVIGAMERRGGPTGDWDKSLEMQIAPDIVLESAHIAYALGQPPAAPQGVQGRAALRLEAMPPFANGQPARLRVAPPRDYHAGAGEWLYSLVAAFNAPEDTARGVRGDSELVEGARLRALAELPRVKTRFQMGLKPGETLYVKQGFSVGGGTNEYLWIVVNTWRGDRLQGQISNAPQMRPDLRAGQTVELTDAAIFDWMVRLPSGEIEGAYTTTALMREVGQ